jgi:3-hydroxyisobutyrate dehydrogenase
MKIAFLGLGRMGSVLAGHLLGAGHTLTVWNRTQSASEPFGKRGAAVAKSAADAVRDADVVFTVLFGPDAVREVIVNGRLSFQAGAVWVDITTVSPSDAAEFTEWAARNGVHYVHSPVIGSLGPARAKKLGVLLGGSPDDTRFVEPLVRLWADPERLWTYDSGEKAAAGKLVANLALAVSMQGLVEALRLGDDGGLSTEEVLTTLKGTGLGWITEMKGQNVISGQFDDTQFSAALLAKDARLMVHSTDHPLPALTAAFEALERAEEAGRGESDFSVIAEGLSHTDAGIPEEL